MDCARRPNPALWSERIEMGVKVVDASALGALVFGEPDAPAVAAQLKGSLMVAPHLLWFEIASIALKKTAMHAAYAEQIRAAFRMACRHTMGTSVCLGLLVAICGSFFRNLFGFQVPVQSMLPKS